MTSCGPRDPLFSTRLRYERLYCLQMRQGHDGSMGLVSEAHALLYSIGVEGHESGKASQPVESVVAS